MQSEYNQQVVVNQKL